LRALLLLSRFHAHFVALHEVQRRCDSDAQLLERQTRVGFKVPEEVDDENFHENHRVLVADAHSFAAGEWREGVRVDFCHFLRFEAGWLEGFGIVAPDVLVSVEEKYWHGQNGALGDGIGLEVNFGCRLAKNHWCHWKQPHGLLDDRLDEGKVLGLVVGERGVFGHFVGIDLVDDFLLDVFVHGDEEDAR
jgi:hypothetical protein